MSIEYFVESIRRKPVSTKWTFDKMTLRQKAFSTKWLSRRSVVYPMCIFPARAQACDFRANSFYPFRDVIIWIIGPFKAYSLSISKQF